MDEQNGTTGLNGRLNWLRAAVLGANDGIVSIAALVAGVAGANSSAISILQVGVAGLIAGAFSMALGEYVSVSSQLDVERSILEKERIAHRDNPEEELEELAGIYEEKGLSRRTAKKVAAELSEKDAFKAHLDAELGIDPDDLSNPLHAAIASAVSFSVGGLIPLLAIVLPPMGLRLPVTFAAVVAALIITGTLSARVSGVGQLRPTIRIVIGGLLAMAITFGVGRLFGAVGI